MKNLLICEIRYKETPSNKRERILLNRLTNNSSFMEKTLLQLNKKLGVKFNTSFQSSNLKAYAYDPVKNCLYIIFHSKVMGNIKIYVYRGISQSLFYSLENAESKGKFFSSEIRNKFTFNTLTLTSILDA